IGSKSLINAPGGNADINGAGHLSCYFNNSELIYSNLESISSCQFLSVKNQTGLDFFQIQKTNIKNVYQFINARSVDNIVLYNSSGVRIKSSNHFNEATINYPLNEYSSGIYFVAVLNRENERKVFKVLLD
ncbi:MAG: T9SS type A sorting domain-containing protein, partial [Limnohabitans sp.]|nr:T9SS type A sorting domain-containing protein [Limnohabitans sp.]